MLEKCISSGGGGEPSFLIYFMYVVLVGSMVLAPVNVAVAICFRKRNRNYERPQEEGQEEKDCVEEVVEEESQT